MAQLPENINPYWLVPGGPVLKSTILIVILILNAPPVTSFFIFLS
jgi:hypothetical protein